MNPSLISVYDKEKKTGSHFSGLSTRVLDGDQTDEAPLSQAEVLCESCQLFSIISVVLSLLPTPLIDTINIYFQDYEICMHCLKV